MKSKSKSWRIGASHCILKKIKKSMATGDVNENQVEVITIAEIKVIQVVEVITAIKQHR